MILGQPFNTSDDHFDSMVPIVINETGYTMFDYDSRDGYIYWVAVRIFLIHDGNMDVVNHFFNPIIIS